MIEDSEVTIGVISDTHGLLRQSAVERLQGVDLILHAGDICSGAIPDQLSQIAPFYAVRGNNDPRDCGWPLRELVTASGDHIYMVHKINDLDIVPAACNVKVVVSGHTHQWSCREKDGVLYVDPGSIGPRRFHYPITFGFLKRREGKWFFEVVYLES